MSSQLAYRSLREWNEANALFNLKSFKNRYFGIRHGQSQANFEKILVGEPELGCSKYPLTAMGREQVQQSVASCKFLPKNIQVIASDFLRTRETAEEVVRVLGLSGYSTSILLRERRMGEFELKAGSNHQLILDRNIQSPSDKSGNVESALELAFRVTQLVAELEATNNGVNFLFVSHRDVLETLEACSKFEWPFSGSKISNAEIREYFLSNSSA